MTQPLTINEVVHLHYFDDDIQIIVDKEAQAMKRLKYRPNYIVTYIGTNERWDSLTYKIAYKITRATLVYRAGKKRLGKSSKMVCYEETYERALKIEDCLNSIAFAYFQRGEEYKP